MSLDLAGRVGTNEPDCIWRKATTVRTDDQIVVSPGIGDQRVVADIGF
jgi:hypothetical protein